MTQRLRHLRTALLVATVCASTAFAQTVAPLPAFDVASVKLNKSGTNAFRSRYTPSGFSVENTPVLFLIRQAFDLFNSNDEQITGLPEWAKSEHYDIQAKVAEADIPAYKLLTREQRGLMLRALLTDRFKMVAHPVTREAAIYALVVAKGGSKLRQADPANTYPTGLRGPDGKSTGAGMMRMGPTFFEAQAVTIDQLIGTLTQVAGRTVVDKTGLAGKYDISLHWAPDDPSLNAAASPDAGATLFTAVQEQLGLKLESQRGPVPGVVVEHIERPSEN